jgi:uncharacterized protein (AIM24 family)
MSKIALSGPATGTATFTITTPAGTSTDRTLTLPDAAGTIQVSGNPISGTTGTFSGDLSFNSGYGSAAVAYGCRAWVNFNGTGTVAIRASGNVSSITDNGTGDYTVNFTTAMPDANYAINVSAGTGSGSGDYLVPTLLFVPASGSIKIRTIISTSGSITDSGLVCISIFR